MKRTFEPPPAILRLIFNNIRSFVPISHAISQALVGPKAQTLVGHRPWGNIERSVWAEKNSPMTDPWDERYIYLHEWLIFTVYV